MKLLPFEENNLHDKEGSKQNHDHLQVHSFMSFMFLVQLGMVKPEMKAIYVNYDKETLLLPSVNYCAKHSLPLVALFMLCNLECERRDYKHVL